MLQTSIKKQIVCLVSILIIVTCSSCKANSPYLISEYLKDLGNLSGIGSYENLKNWEVITDEDFKKLDEELDYGFLSLTIARLIEEDGNTLNILKNRNWIEGSAKENQTVNKDSALFVINNAVDYINNKVFPSYFDYELNEEIKDEDEVLEEDDIFFDSQDKKYKVVTEVDDEVYISRDAEIEEVYDYFDISDSFEIDFNEAEVIPYGDELEETSYVNNIYQLLSSNNTHVFNTDGYRVSYTVNSSGISIHISKNEDKFTLYTDIDVNKVKPTFKYKYEDEDFKNCYFSLRMNTTEKFGFTSGKYRNYYLSLKDLDGDSFISKVKSMFKSKSDEIEAVIPICTIKTPIPNIPTVNICMELLAKIYANGKIELVLYNAHNIGFETKNGSFRAFYEHDDDFDAITRAAGKAALGINFSLNTLNYRLCDIELDSGLKSELKTTMHLYDKDGNKSSYNSDYSYDSLDELAYLNSNVKVCGDVSFYWSTDLLVNTAKTKMNKLGFSKTFHIFDEDNQVFNNLHHIEDGQFVKTCTRRSKVNLVTNDIEVNSADKIVLNSYAEVLHKGSNFVIDIVTIPFGYSIKDIRYSSSDSRIASINDGEIIAHKPGTCRIEVKTSDDKYKSYINILVSTG